MKIIDLDAIQIFDSRGQPTVEAIVTLENGVAGRGPVPSGASTGQHEAVELRDGEPTRFRGRSVFRAVEHVRTVIRPALLGQDVFHQWELDRRMIELDATPNKARLGANAILAVSMAVAQAGAAARGEPLYQYLAESGGGSANGGDLLPLPEIQIFGGGKHAAGRIDVQDFMVIAMGARSYAEVLEMTFNVFDEARLWLKERDRLAGVADEGGYWPLFDSNEEALGALVEIIQRAGYAPGRDIAISLDIAASDLCRNGKYHFGFEGRQYTTDEFVDLMSGWADRYPIISMEDPLADEDWSGWAELRRRIGNRVQLVGDDLFTTHPSRIRTGMELQAAHAVLIKLNQIGTVSETLEAIRLTQEGGWLPVISARSGETEDVFVSHLAVATGAGQLKVGSFSRSERLAKWNELLRIERQLGARARFLGARIFDRIRN